MQKSYSRHARREISTAAALGERLKMKKFQCTKCSRIIETLPEDYVAPPLLQRERFPVCCGKDMIEVAD